MRVTLTAVVVTLLVIQSPTVSAVGAGPVHHYDAETDSPSATLERLEGVDVPPVLVPPVGFSRYDDSDPLENDNRSAIYESIRESPGIHLAAVTDAVDLSESTVRYHVRVLEEEDVIRTEAVRGKRRLCPASTSTLRGAAALRDAATAPLLEAVRRHEPVTVSRVAAEIDRVQSTASYHLSRLENDELLTRERNGESVLVSLTPEARAMFDGIASEK